MKRFTLLLALGSLLLVPVAAALAEDPSVLLRARGCVACRAGDLVLVELTLVNPEPESRTVLLSTFIQTDDHLFTLADNVPTVVEPGVTRTKLFARLVAAGDAPGDYWFLAAIYDPAGVPVPPSPFVRALDDYSLRLVKIE